MKFQREAIETRRYFVTYEVEANSVDEAVEVQEDGPLEEVDTQKEKIEHRRWIGQWTEV